VVKATLSQYDVDRPFAILRDLGPALLDLKGALGAAPETLAAVRGLCGRGPSQYSRKPVDDFDAQAIATDIQTRVQDLVDAVSEEQPLVIWIEDADRMDRASQSITAALLNDERSACVLTTSRTPFAIDERLGLTPILTNISLGPLTTDDSVLLLAALFRHANNSSNSVFTQNAVKVAAGVPLFLTLLFRHFLVTQDGVTLPESLTASLIARLQRLEEPMKSVFDAVVVLGSDCDMAVLAEMMDLPRFSLISAVRALEEQGFATSEEGTLVASHELLADTASRRIPPGTRSLLHRSAARALETRPVKDPTAVARHWAACGEHDKAVAILRQSAASFMDIGRPNEAIRLLERARQLATTTDGIHTIDTALLEACFAAGEDHTGFTIADRIGVLGGRGPHEYQLMAIEMGVGAGKSLAPFTSHLLQIVLHHGLDSGVRGRAARLLVIIAEDTGAVDLATRAIEEIRELPDDRIEALTARLIFETVFGSPDEAILLASRVIAIATTLSTVGVRLKALQNASMALWRCGSTSAALRVGEEGYNLAFEHSIWSACTIFGSMMSNMTWDINDQDQCQLWFCRTEEAIKQSGWPNRGYQHMGVAISLLLARKDVKGAMSVYNEAERLYPELAKHRRGVSFLAHRLRIQLEAGEELSSEDLDTLLEGHLARRHLGFQDFVADTVIAALRQAGRHEEAARLRDEYVTTYRKDRFPIAATSPYLVPRQLPNG
jgi:hypothetical protein